MIDYTRLNRRNALIAMAVQASTGLLGHNVRMLKLEIGDAALRIIGYLGSDDPQDREDLADIADDLSILTENERVDLAVHVVGSSPLSNIEPEDIVIFRERINEKMV